MSSLLARFAREQQNAEIWRSERAASSADAASAATREEDGDWTATLSDGIA
ncbi:MAG TPA: hypothetical protein VN889_07120 [Solirubrobacteraceae bacterium]|nr:hypothetical protein [Solirubrobacteraceae bacterium]